MLKEQEFYSVKHRRVVVGKDICFKKFRNGAHGLVAYHPVDGTKLIKFVSKTDPYYAEHYPSCRASSKPRSVRVRKTRKCKYGRSKSTGKCYKPCKSGERRSKKTGHCKKKPCKYGRSKKTGKCKKSKTKKRV
jgi:hypothetical protein